MTDTTAMVAATATSWSCVGTPFEPSAFQCSDLSYGGTSNTTLYILPVVGDADIAGIEVSAARSLGHIWLTTFAQVIITFLVSAYATALIAYWVGFLPDNLLTTYDIRLMKARKTQSEEERIRWSRVLVKDTTMSPQLRAAIQTTRALPTAPQMRTFSRDGACRAKVVLTIGSTPPHYSCRPRPQIL